MYVRNASGLVRDRARLLHILVILFIVIWISHRNILGILILFSSKGLRSQGYIILSRNICTKANTTVLTDKFQMSMVFFINGCIYGLVMTYCYFIALKNRYKQNIKNTFSSYLIINHFAMEVVYLHDLVWPCSHWVWVLECWIFFWLLHVRFGL